MKVNQIGREWEQILFGKKKTIKMLNLENLDEANEEKPKERSKSGNRDANDNNDAL